MKKISVFLAFLAGAMLPLTAVAQESAVSKSSKDKSSKKKHAKKDAAADSQQYASEEPPTMRARAEEAEDEGVSMTDEQILLNNQAGTATKNGDFRKAEQLYNALLQIGEINLIWYNLGKTYANQDKCIEAADAYSRVASAPKINNKDSGVDTEQIIQSTNQAIEELNIKCSAKLSVSCAAPDMTMSIDSTDSMPCSDKIYSVVPGKHSITGRTSKGFNTIVVNTPADKITSATIEVIDYESIAELAGITPEELEKRSKLFKILGYTFLGVGVAAAAGGAGLWYYAYNDYHKLLDCYEGRVVDCEQPQDDVLKDSQSKNYTREYIGIGLVAGGAALAVTGSILLIYDAVKIQPQLKELQRALSVAPVISPDFSGMTFSLSF